MSRKFKEAIGYSNITLEPHGISEVLHRADCDTTQEFLGLKLRLPLVSAPMSMVTDGNLAKKMWEVGCFGWIHRFLPIKEQVEEYCLATREMAVVGCAIGATGDYLERLNELITVGCKHILIDIAHGQSIVIGNAVKAIRSQSKYDDIKLAGGNVATAEGFRYLAELGLDGARILIGSGSACKTRYSTAVFVPEVTALLDCLEERDKIGSKIPIIACGGIKSQSEFCKAIALGATVCMCGSLIASCDESPAMFLRLKGVIYKVYFGESSYAAQLYRGKKPQFIEGDEALIERSGKLYKTTNMLKEGLQSSMSYLSAKNLTEYRSNASFVKI